MPDTPTPAPSVGQRVAARFDLTDKRNLAGLGILCFCAGIMVGARIMRGAVPPLPQAVPPAPGDDPPQPGGGVAPGGIPFDVPCAGCRERMVREGRAIAAQHAAAAARQAGGIGEDDAERRGVADRQMGSVEGMRSFSPYAEATLPANLVEQGDSSLPPEAQP